MKYALQFAKDMVPDGTKFDVFNCLNIMANAEFLKRIKKHHAYRFKMQQEYKKLRLEEAKKDVKVKKLVE